MPDKPSHEFCKHYMYGGKHFLEGEFEEVNESCFIFRKHIQKQEKKEED